MVRGWGIDDEVIDFARKSIEEHGFRNKKELSETDSGLYSILSKRKLLDKVVFEECFRRWGTDEEVLEAARTFIEENGIKNRCRLEKADSGLYSVLRSRKLLDAVCFKERRELREWGSDENVLGIARRFIEEEGIKNRKGLETADQGLYHVLARRGLLDGMTFEKRLKHRKWGTDEELVGFAMGFMGENGILGRSELKNADYGLYQVLTARKLLDHVFASIDQDKHQQAVHGVLDAMDRFGKD